MRRPVQVGEVRGFVYDEVEPGRLEALAASMEDCVPPAELGAEPLFDHGVRVGYRAGEGGELVVKYYRGGRFRDRFRPSAAVRAADAYAALLPIRSPRPTCALELRRRGDLERSLIVCEFVDGPLLGTAWGTVPEAEEALGPFLARMHGRWIYHGVMKWDHLVWNRGEWVVLDTESLRHPLRKLRTKQLAERQWGALAMDLGVSDRLERAFRSYLEARQVSWDADATWAAIVGRAEAMLGGRDRR